MSIDEYSIAPVNLNPTPTQSRSRIQSGIIVFALVWSQHVPVHTFKKFQVHRDRDWPGRLGWLGFPTITTSCLYLIQQLYRKSLVFDTENLNIALSLVVSLHHLSPRLFFAHRHYHELLVFDTATLSEIACIWYAIFTLSLQRVNSYFHCLLPFFRVLVLFEMGMLNSLNPVC
jgi:hypothetical protein